MFDDIFDLLISKLIDKAINADFDRMEMLAAAFEKRMPTVFAKLKDLSEKEILYLHKKIILGEK